MKILVTGSRGWNQRGHLFNALDGIEATCTDAEIVVIHGGARGADRLAGEWAGQAGHTEDVHLPDWSSGRGAGFKRNEAMLALRPDLVVAFSDGESKGTGHCIRKARALGLRVEVISPQQ